MRVMRAEPYTRDILRLAAAIPGQVGFDELDGVAEHRSRTCGSRVRVAVEVDDEGRVRTLRQAVEACAYGQAAAALMAIRAPGRDAASARADLETLEAWLAGSELPGDWPELAALEPALDRPGRHDAILLPFRALAAATEAAAR